MPPVKGATYQDRQTAASDARKALVQKFQARPKPDDPVVLELEAKRRAVVEARNARLAEREREKAERLAREKVERETRERVEAEAREKARIEAEVAAEKAR